MPDQSRLPFQAMTAEDRQFDALLRRAAQHFQEVKEVKLDIQRHRNISGRESGMAARQAEGLPRT